MSTMTVRPGRVHRARSAALTLARRVSWADAPFIAALLIVTFPAVSPPNGSLDSSWATGLAWARQLHLPFGSAIDFTYGPWSILDASAVFSGWMFGCWLVACASTGWLVLFLVRAVLRRRLGRMTTGLVILVVLTPVVLLIPYFSMRVLFIAVTVSFVGFAAGATRRFEILVAVSATLSAVATLDKFSSGVLAMGLTGLAALTGPRTLRLRLLTAALAGAVFLVAVPVWWLSAGQRLADFLPWLRASIELTSGYADAMAVEVPQAFVGYPVVAALVAALAVHTVRARHLTTAPIATAVVIAVGVVIGIRTGFTRNDVGHAEQTFALISLLALLAGVGFARFRWAAAIAAASMLAMFASGSVAVLPAVDPGLLAGRAEQTANAAMSAGYRAQLTDTAANVLWAQYRPGARVLAALKGRTVHVDPFAANVAWAYQLDWKPVPVFQSYAAYTPYLDQLNADSLASPNGPQSILKAPLGAIDQRNPMWESPEYVKAMICNYATAVETSAWLVLDRVDNRCSSESRISSQHVQPGQEIAVPPAPNDHTMVVARLTLDPDPLNTLATAIFKPLRRLEVTTGHSAFQLPRGEANGPLVLRLPDNVGWPTTFGGGYTVPKLSLNQGATIQFFAVGIH